MVHAKESTMNVQKPADLLRNPAYRIAKTSLASALTFSRAHAKAATINVLEYANLKPAKRSAILSLAIALTFLMGNAKETIINAQKLANLKKYSPTV